MKTAAKWLALLFLPAIAFAAAHKHVKHEHWPSKYDHHFKKYTKHYFGPHVDWHWFKAQGIAESGLKPKARSAVGAKGVMQIMPSTYKEILAKNPYFAGIEDPKWNIAAGIFYDRMLYRKWKKKQIPTSERLTFAFASYNAGFGGVLKARKKARKVYGEEVKVWKKVAKFAPSETRGYVKRINKLMEVN